MKEFIEKLIDRLEEMKNTGSVTKTEMLITKACVNKAINIVNELAEEHKDKDCSECSRRKFYQQGYEDAKNDNWILCSERLPEEGQSIVAVYPDGKVWPESFSLWLYNQSVYKMVTWFPMPSVLCTNKTEQ